MEVRRVLMLTGVVVLLQQAWAGTALALLVTLILMDVWSKRRVVGLYLSDIAVFYRLERRRGTGRIKAAIYAVDMALNCPF